MRTSVSSNEGVHVRAIAGTHTVLLAIDLDKTAREGLLGFAIRREEGDREGYWLRGSKVFPSVVPQPAAGQKYSTLEQPIQSLLWGDYTAKPGVSYRFLVRPLYGRPKALRGGTDVALEVTTEDEGGAGHGVWFNRGAIASQAYAERFANAPPPSPDDPEDDQTAWLSRGLLEACLRFIEAAGSGDGLRVAAYEFTYSPVLSALKRAIRRGVDVKVVHEAGQTKEKGHLVSTDATEANAEAIRKAKFPAAALIARTRRASIPHNKFMVLLQGNTVPKAVWTGSTNLTPSGFLGQANVGHSIEDSSLAQSYLEYWTALSSDPDPEDARDAVEAITPDPPDDLPQGITALFSPRHRARMLKWYAQRIEGAREAVLFTGAFGVNEKLAAAFSKDRDFLRYLLLEKPPSRKTAALLGDDHDLITVSGNVLGEVWKENDKGELTLRRRIPGFEVERWFLEEEHYRRNGNIFFVHLKTLLIDPLSDDPLILTGSANFSDASLLSNDENMLLIRGDTRIADIYMTELDRLLRHFYFRGIAAALNGDGQEGKAIFLEEKDSWLKLYFKEGAFKDRRRRLFFPA